MREIKFRFFDYKLSNSMIYQDPIEAKNVIFDKWETTPKCSTLMQYTGLKDNNGKDIYEGDILKVSTASSERGNWKVYFEMGSYDAKRIQDGYIEDLVDVVIDCEGINQCMVIGNIYENPELLESEAK